MKPEDIKQKLDKLGPRWTVNKSCLRLKFKTRDFKQALAIIARVGKTAEALNHHPDISLRDYNRLAIATTTHSAGGLTDKDFELAGQIDAILNRLK